MRILGVDPGTLFTGYAVIECTPNTIRILKCDVIKNSSRNSLPLRLKNIYDVLVDVIEEYLPDEFAIETAYYGKNVQSTLKLGHARGVSILAAVNKQIPTAEYSPREVKKSVVGIGTASKEQVRYMVNSLLKAKVAAKSLDISDAIAVAVCHYNKLNKYTSGGSKWEDYVKKNPKKVKIQSFK
jgi:crossover junction endodeoxyribonuclease RuvC